MNLNNQTSLDHSDLPMYQTENNFAPLHINNDQHTSINTAVEMSNTSTTTPTLQNDTFEFYFPLPNDTRIYHVTYQYTELHPLENARRLNNSINLSRIPGHDIQQNFFDTNIQSTSQVYSDSNDSYNTASNSVSETISDKIQVTGFQNS
ncbi:8804_t:CDS:2 [Rhizophagus irregularis]|nr:8804_t:CDS:2 [Rhizophagus irregularis]